jgi:energy-coupling factor transporter ATP-binding protein EcfA2
VLSLDGVRYRYAGAARPSLLDIDLEVGSGEVVGLTGASEAGKTTLCLVASGLAPRAIRGELVGRVLLDNDDTAALRMDEMVTRVGICFQDPATQLSGVCGTVYEEVAFGPMNLGLPREEIVARTEGALSALAIAKLAARDPARLSGGQAQLVALAGILAMRPGHLILDEPTAQLDPQGTELVAEAVASLAAAGSSILIAEQKTDLLERVCQRVVVLAGGRIVMDGPGGVVLTDPRLPGMGVAPPSSVRLRDAVAGAGLDPALIEVAA